MITLTNVPEQVQQRAYDRACQTYDTLPVIEQVGPHTYTMTSSNGHTDYTLDLDGDNFSCSCPAGKSSVYCKHHQILKAWLATQPAPAQFTNIVRFACVNYDLAPMTWLELDELQERVERAGCDLYHRYTTGKLNKESYKKYDAENTAIIEAIQDQKAALLDDSDETMESLDDRADWMAA